MIDPDLTPDEAALSEAARSWFTAFVDNTYLNEQQDSETGYEQGRWKEMCALGWTAINLPERVGGSGGNLSDVGVVLREVGRAAFASPLLATTRAATLLDGLNQDKHFDNLLERIAAGTPVALVAPADDTICALPISEGRYRLTGSPTVVEWLSDATDAAIILPIDAGTWVCGIVPAGDLRGRVVGVPSIDNERIARVDLEGFELLESGHHLVSISSRNARKALSRANLLRASLMVGGGDVVLDRSVQYAKERVQFGKPIGSFQAVRHHLARMAIANDAARLVCNDALTRATPEADEIAIAATSLFVAGRSYVEIVLTAAQVHGGVGTTVEHVLHHHFVRAKAMQLRSGKRANRLREIHEALNVRHEASLW